MTENASLVDKLKKYHGGDTLAQIQDIQNSRIFPLRILNLLTYTTYA